MAVAPFPALAGALVLLAIVALASVYVWRSPRRATLASLKVAIAGTTRQSLRLRSASERGRVRPFLGEDGARSRAGVVRDLDKVATAVGDLARRLTPPAYYASVVRRLTLAGHARQTDVTRYLAARFVTAVAMPVALVVLVATRASGLYALMGLIGVFALLGLGPEAALNHMTGKRQERIRTDLPTMIELLMISVEAGLAFDQALVRSVGYMPGPVSDEFSRYLGEVRMGASRGEALEAMDKRTGVDELHSFLMALAQAETFGVSVGGLLRSQAANARVAQRQHVQEQAQKAPVKMLFPLVFCVLPALFVVVVGPAAIEIYRTLIK